MRRATILVLPLLLLCFSAQVSAQSRGNTGQPPTNLRTPKEPVVPTAVSQPPSPEREAEAKKLYEDGLKLTEAEQFPQAAESFQQAVKLNNKYADAYSALGRTYFKMGQWQKAIDNLRRASELHREVREAKNEESRSETSLASNIAENIRPNDSLKPSQASNTNAALDPPQPELKKSKKGSTENSQPNPNSGVNAFSSNPPAQLERPRTATPPKTATPENKQAPKANANSSVVLSNPTAQPGPQPQTTTPPKTAAPENKQAPKVNASSSVVLSNRAAQPGPQSQTTTPPKTNGPETKQQPANANVSSSALGSTPSTQPQKSTTAPKIVTPDTKQPVPNSGVNAARRDSNPLPKPDTSEPKLQGETANARSTTTLPPVQQPQINSTPNSKTAAVQSHPTQKFEKAAIATLTADTGTGLSQAPTGERVAMNVTPSSQPLETNTVTPVPAKPPTDDVALTKIYRVGSNDVLDVRVNDSESPKSTLFTITSAGLLEYPLLAEPLSVTGLTVEEIGTRIEEDLKKRALIENPKVIVGVRDYGSHTIIVSGLVKDAGTKFLMREAIPLYVVVADAQPLPEAAKVTLVRNEMNQVFEVDLMRAADMNLLVRPGDVLTFQPNVTQFVYIGGDVKIPGEKTFRRGLTLTQVILTAGGVTPKAIVAQIARDDGRGFLAETSFKLKDISSGKTVDPLLKPGDRILILR